jgi:hypothetical protein
MMADELYGFDERDTGRIGAAVRAYEGLFGKPPNRTLTQDRNYAKVPFRNDNAGTAPAFGVLRVTGTTTVDQFAFLTVDQPDSSFNALYLVNGTEDVASGGTGWGTWLYHGGRVLYDAGTPAIGQIWGAASGQWSLTSGKAGFLVIGGNDTTLGTTIAVQTVETTSGIPFYNDSGESIPPYSVMWEIDETTISSTQYAVVRKPSSTFDRFWLVNGASTIAPAGTGTGTWLFETTGPVAIDSTASALGAGNELGPKPSSWLLFPYRRGFTTLGSSYTANGVTVSDCKQRQVDHLFGKTYSTLTASSPDQTCQFEIWERGGDGKPRVSGWDKITVYGLMLQKDDVVKVGTWGWADWQCDNWEADFACDPDNTDSSKPSGSSSTSYSLMNDVADEEPDLQSIGSAATTP